MEKLLSTPEVAQLLGISRVAVFKKIKSGEIKAEKVGRNFVVRRDDVPGLGDTLNKATKNLIEQFIKKTVTEYGETLKLLGKE